MFFDFVPPIAFNFDQNDSPRAFDFRICFGKILVVSHFDEQLTQKLGEITM